MKLLLPLPLLLIAVVAMAQPGVEKAAKSRPVPSSNKTTVDGRQQLCRFG